MNSRRMELLKQLLKEFEKADEETIVLNDIDNNVEYLQNVSVFFTNKMSKLFEELEREHNITFDIEDDGFDFYFNFDVNDVCDEEEEIMNDIEDLFRDKTTVEDKRPEIRRKKIEKEMEKSNEE